MTTVPDPQRPGPSRQGDADGWYPEPYHAGWAPPTPRPSGPASPGAPPAGTGGRRRGRGGLVVLVVLVLLAAVAASVVAVRTWADQQPLGPVSGAVSAHPRQLAVGHCLAELPPDGTVERVTVVPCAEPHAAEVVGVTQLTGDAWPGRSEVERRAQAACEMDRRQAEAGLRPVVWTPGEAAWGDGERRALCLAWLEGGGLTGSWTEGDAVVP